MLCMVIIVAVGATAASAALSAAVSFLFVLKHALDHHLEAGALRMQAAMNDLTDNDDNKRTKNRE